MAEKILNTRIQNKRDSESNWNLNNPVLLDGELIIVDTSDGVKAKIGDGTSRYSELEFIGGDGLPPCSASDNGKFLRVVSGAAAWDTIPSAELNSF